MGRTATSKYIVHVTVPGYAYSPASWRCDRSGRPSAEHLAAYVKGFEDSTRPGGVNAHLGRQRVTRATVKVNEPGGRIVATYQAPAEPMFTVVADSAEQESRP